MVLVPVLLVLAGAVSASVDFGNWHPPVPGEVRSPCPGLNSLANHGILPRDGKNYTLDLVVNATGKALNLSAELATIATLAGLHTGSDGKTFNLDDLKKHGIIEHDASLSRKDTHLGGEEQEFDPTIFHEFLGYFDGAGEITYQLAAAARWGRVQTERGRNPEFNYGPSSQFSSYVESSLYFEVLKDPKTGMVPIDFIKVFFSEERLPYNEGWRTPVTPFNGFALSNGMLQLSLNTPEDAPAGLSHGGSFHSMEL